MILYLGQYLLQTTLISDTVTREKNGRTLKAELFSLFPFMFDKKCHQLYLQRKGFLSKIFIIRNYHYLGYHSEHYYCRSNYAEKEQVIIKTRTKPYHSPIIYRIIIYT